MLNKSYLKYAGGKARILEEVLACFPANINRFVEPFVGSATVALNVQANTYLLADLNADVINCHVQVKAY